MTVHFYTATSLDGFIATTDHSLDWLFKQDFDPAGPMNYTEFLADMGALVMGASTYQWLRDAEPTWPYEVPTIVMTHRDLEASAEADVKFRQGDVREIHADLVAAAGDKDIWIVGGGDIAGQFADAGLLDEIWVQFAPVTLGAGQPLLPRALDLELIELAQNRAFVCAHYRVVKQ
ncbi:dihydrofolate reductase [Gulosibacter macacae]|uniref:Dihydrofolate reductase n=1 Tax=Gulosibacter macacae TaxID=2488791 RepID=A0A3P3VYF4_9MICO|nr:dihydrofolate reductase family protein [Gulosibacter macacae]RRJ86459.1 dihydrofolate reductase [Gulosibacter macacae]